jgi:hypothetical protein
VTTRWHHLIRWLRRSAAPFPDPLLPDGSPPAPFDFDALAQALAAGMPRREALRRLGLGLGSVLLASLGLAKPSAAQACPPGTFRCGTLCCDNRFVCCNGTCRNPSNDRNNCGGCGTVCPANEICCSGRCVRLSNDPNNCGSCGRACLPGQNCVNGACLCPAGQVLCYGRCTNRATDPNNCGGCGIRCTGGRVCCYGLCVCPAGQTFCGTA